ncbi:MAG: hypothetical protein ACQGVK_03310 [Myxococcota bacterium]
MRAALVATVALLVATSARAQDSSAPTLADASIAPAVIDVVAGAAGGTLVTHVRDDVSGFSVGGAFLVSPAQDGFVFVAIESEHRVSGDALDGAYASPFDLPESSRAGTWSVHSVSLTDLAGNTVDLPATVLPPGSLFEVVSIEDDGPPVLGALSLSSGAVDVTAGPGVLTLSAVLSDDESGVATATVSFASPSGEERVDVPIDAGDLVSGDGRSGTYEATFEVPQLAEDGSWTVADVHLVDRFGYAGDLDGGALPPAAAPSFSVASSDDDVPPTLVWFTAEPTPVNVLAPPATLTLRARITDAVTGLRTAGVLLESPVEAVGSAAAFDADHRISGDARDGIYESTVILEGDAPLGVWSIRLSLADVAGNSSVLEGGAIPGPSVVSVALLQACENGQDDDEDGLVDLADPGCAAAGDASEHGTAACDNGADDDGDGATDAVEDPDCRGPADPSETPDCSDGLDNDGDGAIDAADPACVEPDLQLEDPQCDDGLDNDDDGLVDFPDDPQCKSAAGRETRGCGLGAELVAFAGLLCLGRRRRRSREGGARALSWIAMAIALVGSGSARSAAAAEITWFAGDGSWDVVANWYPFQLPSDGDLAWVKAPDGSALSVSYRNALDPTLDTFNVDTQGSGTLDFLQTRDSLRAITQNVGIDGRNATYRLSGGSNTVPGKLRLGVWGSGYGRYELSGTGALTTNDTLVGVAGGGTMIQTGGTHHANGDLDLAFFASAASRYELSGAGQLRSARQYLGAGGHATFVQSGGSNSVAGTIVMGQFASATSRYELSAGSVGAASLHVGQGGRADFVQTGGSVHTADGMVVARDSSSVSSYRLVDGTLDVLEQRVGVFGNAAFEQSGGTNDVRGYFALADGGPSHSRYELSGGDLTTGSADVGVWGSGTFSQSGGSWLIDGRLRLGFWGSAYGRLEISGGELEADSVELGDFGTGQIIQDAGLATVHEGIDIAIFATSSGLYWLRGGTLDTPRVSVEPTGRLEFSGGALAVDRIDVLGTLGLSGEGTRVVDAEVVNNGRVEVVDSEVVYSDLFTNSKVYVSQGVSSSEFFHLGVAPDAWIEAGPDSRFVVTVSMLATSERNDLWDTSEAELVLDGPGGHILRHPGRNIGPTYAGTERNFAWGRLTIADGDPVTLEDGNDVPGGALYVGVLDLQGGVGQAATITGNGIDIYYDPTRPENDYLGGLSYPLLNGGEIAPIRGRCEDGWDDDGDGLVDFPADPGCKNASWPVENPACEDGSDNDLDGLVDWDGGGVGDADPQCAGQPWRQKESPSQCGLGAELGLALLVIDGLRRRRRTLGARRGEDAR